MPNDMTREERDALILGCQNLCRKLASSAAGTVPGADVDDLYGEALLACVEAAATWTPDGDAKFSTFAASYIRKRLMGPASDQRREAGHARPEDWNDVADPDARGWGGAAPISPEDTDRLAKLDEPARSAVRLVVFRGESPDRAAAQLGMSVKDLKLVLRNSAKTLIRLAAVDAATPPLFGPPDGPCGFCAGTGSVCRNCAEPEHMCDCPAGVMFLIPCPDCGAIHNNEG